MIRKILEAIEALGEYPKAKNPNLSDVPIKSLIPFLSNLGWVLKDSSSPNDIGRGAAITQVYEHPNIPDVKLAIWFDSTEGLVAKEFGVWGPGEENTRMPFSLDSLKTFTGAQTNQPGGSA